MNLDLLSLTIGFALGGVIAVAVWLHFKSLTASMTDRFKVMADEALANNHETLIDVATAQLGAREQSFRDLIAPITQRLSELDRSQHSLTQHMTSLSGETGKLVNALKTPHVRGRWGEVQLKRVVELAGMLEHCDFDPQVTTDNGRRPDLVVNLPGGKQIAIDAKTPLDAYLRAGDAADEAERKLLMAQHAKQVREHIKQLSAKSYWEQFANSPEFVVLFLPGENFYAAALQAEPDLIEVSAQERVVLATPTTLIALLHAVRYGWRQEKLADTAKEIAALGAELHERADVLVRHFSKVGDSLDKAVGSYNSALTSLESRLLVTARKLQDTGAVSSDKVIEEPKAIERRPRLTTSLIAANEEL
jgi:DNA recombination protein RmuC